MPLGSKTLYCKKLNDLNLSFKGKSLGEWITFKVGIKNSKKEDGFVKVFLDENLVMNYSLLLIGKDNINIAILE